MCELKNFSIGIVHLTLENLLPHGLTILRRTATPRKSIHEIYHF